MVSWPYEVVKPYCTLLVACSLVVKVIVALEVVTDVCTFEMVGAVVSFETSAVIEVLLVFPDVSVAVAVIVWDPLVYVVVSQDAVYGADESVVITVVPTLKVTDATPLSSDADAEIVAVPETMAPSDGVVIEMLGGVVSAVVTP